MPHPRPPYLHRQISRHGKAVWYVRKGQGSRLRVRLRQEYGTPEFWAAYRAAVDSEPPPQAAKAAGGSLAWLIERYQETTAWADLSPATRRNRENHFKSAGHQPCRAITQKHLVEARDTRSATPAQARNFLDAMRGLFKWAKSAQHVAVDPTDGVKNPRRIKGPGFPVWTEADVQAYYKRWPIGTKERVWLDVLLFTGLRRGDAVMIGRQHVRDGVATLRTEKSRGEITVSTSNIADIAANARRWTDRRPRFYLRHKRQAVREGIVWHCL
jgi:integrase